MTSSPVPPSFYLEKDEFLYTDLVSLQIADSRPQDGPFSSFKHRLGKILPAITPSWPKSCPPLPVTIAKNWHLGLTSFGGPPVQFQMVSFGRDLKSRLCLCLTIMLQLHKKFVEKEGWIDEQLVSFIFCPCFEMWI